MERFWQDLRYGARLLLRFPAVTAAALLALALGTGVNTALFSIVNTVLLQPLPFPDADELVQVWRTLQLVLREGFLMSAVGITVGLAGAFAASRLLGALL